MKPLATLRFRRVTAFLAVAWAGLALVSSVHGWVSADKAQHPPFLLAGFASDPWRIQHVSPIAAAAGVEPGDRVLRIDGRSVDAAMLLQAKQFEPGRVNRYRIRSQDGREREVSLPSVTRRSISLPLLAFASLTLPLVGLVYLATGLVVWRLRPGRSESWALLLFCAMMAADLFVARPVGGPSWAVAWLSIPLIGATVFHLFTLYPVDADWVVRRPWLRPSLYAAALVLGALALAEGPFGVPPGTFKTAAFYFTVGLGLLCFGLGARQRRHLRETTQAARADVMFYGALVSFVPVLAVLVAQNLLQTSLPWYLAFLWCVLFPVAVGYGIVRRQLFEIRAVARSSVAHGASTLAITGLYAFLIVFADAIAGKFPLNARSPWFHVVFLFFAILAFNPLRNRLQRVVDRVFDRDRSLYREAVREISEAMVSMLSTKEIVDRILVALTDTMGVDRALVMLQDPEGEGLAVSASRGEWDPEALEVRVPLTHPICARLQAGRQELARSDFDADSDPERRETCRDVFDTLEVELLVPILFGAELLGAIAVSPKLTGERFTWDDRQLLRTLANQSSIAIENARAFDEIAKLNETLEARVETRTHELHEAQAQLVHSEKMRSLGQLVAGVAHELNNPIGFVHANLQLLKEYVERLMEARARGDDTARLEDSITKLLSRSREGTERVKKIVKDLRTFSRMDQADLAEVDLHQEIEKTLTLMQPRLKEGIRVERDYGQLPRVRCFVGQLNQVFLNLLMNACDALEGGGTIRIHTRPLPGGVRLEFHDDGPGIPPELQARIFEPFFTTKEVGRGTGLGLSLSHGIVERHGGRMLVGSAPGEGTTFVVELPLDAEPGAE